MNTKKAKAEKWWQEFTEKSFTDQCSIMQYFIGKTVQSIEIVDAEIIVGTVPTSGKQTTVRFTDGSGFTLDQQQPVNEYRFPKGVTSPFSTKIKQEGI